MVEIYSAFGLTLRSALSLPGMRPAEPSGLPEVSVEVVSPAELDASWSGPARPGSWRGRLGDGEELRIEWGEAGDLLFAYGERARFHLDPSGARLACAPRGDGVVLDWQRVLLTRILPNVSLAHGREALHAGAVETPLGVIAIAASSGTGKSTLAAELAERGWPLFADDVLVLEQRGPGDVVAHPAGPHANLSAEAPREDSPAVHEELGTVGGERWVAVERTSSEPRAVAAVALLERRPGLSLEAEAIDASPVALAPFMLGLPDDEGRDASRFDLYSDLIDSATLLRLSAAPEDAPGELAESLERTLGLSRSAALGGPV